jgi:hypothetical protein
MLSQARSALTAAAGGLSDLVRRRRPADTQRLPPLTTQSSPGQIADLQQAYGADMAPPSVPPPGEDAWDG